jgi:hypothetical protein
LLLAGLTHYFADQHEQAINVWTRVLFIDRGHARARAYIERARSAVAERQRHGDELLHGGLLALDRGDPGEARALVALAVEHGASPDEALSVLARIDRLENAAGTLQPQPRRAVPDAGLAAAGRRRPAFHWVVAGLGGIILGASAILALSGADLRALVWGGPPPTTPQGLLTTKVPVPTAAEVALMRGEALFARGRLHEALVSLAAVPAGDPLRSRADEIAAAIQKQLLAAGRDDRSDPESAARRP